ncbi:hypothetical protein [Actinoplanes sp. NBRC 101535]|uniref:hypothetical protein n=1 Tax=Actinoplanes sp. NBRC 101535 TaxID=3032196 RepID=UPI002555F08B|nr:hypothetical protein [Actinoplanes sp. NBRC 101535]
MAGTRNPATAPGATVQVNSDGSVTAHGPRAWVWCTDESTGARADYPASMLPKAGLKPVAGYEVNFKKVGRSPKTVAELAAIGETGSAKGSSKKEPGQ